MATTDGRSAQPRLIATLFVILSPISQTIDATTQKKELIDIEKEKGGSNP